MTQFIKDVYEADLLKADYLDCLEKRGIRNNLVSAIHDADVELLKSILTYFVRQERFCDGVWAQAVREKAFLKILTRFKDLEQ